MSRLAKVLECARSGDILPGNSVSVEREEARKYLEEKAEKESGAVRTTLDLSLFKRFDAKSQSLQGRRKGKWFRVDNKGNITLTDALSREFEDGARVGIYLNQKGTILVMREEPDGILLTKMYKTSQRSMMRRCTCRDIAWTLEQAGVKLPIRFMVEWDENLQAWVGRREDLK